MVVHLLATITVPPGIIDTAAARWPIPTGLSRHIGFDPYDRVDAARSCTLVKVEDTVHVPMVSDRHGGLVILFGFVQEVVDSGGAIEHRVLGVGVKVDKRLHLPFRLASATRWLRRLERILYATTQMVLYLLGLVPLEKEEGV